MRFSNELGTKLSECPRRGGGAPVRRAGLDALRVRSLNNALWTKTFYRCKWQSRQVRELHNQVMQSELSASTIMLDPPAECRMPRVWHILESFCYIYSFVYSVTLKLCRIQTFISPTSLFFPILIYISRLFCLFHSLSVLWYLVSYSRMLFLCHFLPLSIILNFSSRAYAPFFSPNVISFSLIRIKENCRRKCPIYFLGILKKTETIRRER